MSLENEISLKPETVEDDAAVVEDEQASEQELLESGNAILCEYLPEEFLESYAPIEDSEIEKEAAGAAGDEAAGKSLDRKRSGNLDTVIMRPSEVRRMGGVKVSSRRTSASGASSGINASRRSRRVSDEELTPEELERRKRNDMQAKIIIYGVVALVTVLFVALLTYKLPFYFPETFPDGIWPWSEILNTYNGAE